MDNLRKVKHFYEHVVSNGLIDEFSEYVADDMVLRYGECVVPAGVEGMRQHIIDVRETYPDLKMKIIRQYIDGDIVISEFVMEGTHLGEWPGTKPTGKKMRITGVDVDRIVNGKIVEHGGAANTFEALFEAGIIKPA